MAMSKNKLTWRQGKCYLLAGGWLLRYGKHNDTDIKLVHGMVHSYITGSKNPHLKHAWIVKGNTVWEPTLDKWWDKYSFYETFRAEDWATYTFQELLQKLQDPKHWGPWDETPTEG